MRVTIGRNRIPPLVLSAFAVVMLFASAAWAADGDPPAAEQVSFLKILLKGAEWPGLFIALMSVVSVTIIIEHFWTIRRTTMIPDDEIEMTRGLIENRHFKECIDYILNRRSMFADVLAAGLRHGRHGFDAMQEAAAERAAAWSSRLFRKVEYLNIIGNLGPLMGLLGTVIGMIRAFSAMQATHGAYKPEDLAGGIGLALVNTFLGLAVAIVSLGLFGVCRNRVDALTVAAHAAVVDLLEYLRPSPAGSGGASAPAAGASTPPVHGEAQKHPNANTAKRPDADAGPRGPFGLDNGGQRSEPRP